MGLNRGFLSAQRPSMGDSRLIRPATASAVAMALPSNCFREFISAVLEQIFMGPNSGRGLKGFLDPAQ